MNLKSRARSEGGSVSHISSDLINGVRREVIVLEEDDDVVEVAAPAPARGSTGLFVTPFSDEPRTTFSPGTSTRRRSTSALQARRASSAPYHASSPLVSNSMLIDLTLESSDEDEGNVQNTMNGANEAAVDGISAQFNLGTKRARLTSPASVGGGDTKRQKSQSMGYRTGSLPLVLRQKWEFPKDA